MEFTKYLQQMNVISQNFPQGESNSLDSRHTHYISLRPANTVSVVINSLTVLIVSSMYLLALVFGGKLPLGIGLYSVHSVQACSERCRSISDRSLLLCIRIRKIYSIDKTAIKDLANLQFVVILR